MGKQIESWVAHWRERTEEWKESKLSAYCVHFVCRFHPVSLKMFRSIGDDKLHCYLFQSPGRAQQQTAYSKLMTNEATGHQLSCGFSTGSHGWLGSILTTASTSPLDLSLISVCVHLSSAFCGCLSWFSLPRDCDRVSSGSLTSDYLWSLSQ